MMTVEEARREVNAASAGGAPFLLCFGATLLACAVLASHVPTPTAALLVMFQGGVALPAAFVLERRMGWARMRADNPLRPLSVQLAMSQMLALPVVIVAYTLNPAAVPLAMAGIAGAHFLPYAWLQGTRVYGALAVAVSIGAFIIQIVSGADAFARILVWLTTCYWIGAPLVYRHAVRMTRPNVQGHVMYT